MAHMASRNPISRTAWLWCAYQCLLPLFKGLEAQPPGYLRVSASRPSEAPLLDTRRACQVAWCFADGPDGYERPTEICIDPSLTDGAEILALLLHEMCHAADGLESGHRRRFWRLWHRVGFTGKPTEATPAPSLAAHLRYLHESVLGPYPT